MKNLLIVPIKLVFIITCRLWSPFGIVHQSYFLGQSTIRVLLVSSKLNSSFNNKQTFCHHVTTVRTSILN